MCGNEQITPATCSSHGTTVLKPSCSPFILGLSAFAIATPAAASNLKWPRLTTTGRIEVGADDATGDNGFLFYDAEATLGSQLLRFNLGAFGVRGREHETYVSISAHPASGGRWDIGMPRPAFDRVAEGAMVHAVPRAMVDVVGETRSNMTHGVFAVGSYLPLGVSYEATRGALRYALSYHGNTEASDHAVGVSMAYAFESFRVEAAAEHVSGALDDFNAKALIGTTLGAFDFDLGYFNTAANGAPRMWEASSDWRIARKITLSAFYQGRNNAPNRSGAAISWGGEEGFTATAGYLAQRGADVMSAQVGWRF
jgi:hypothetical protein